MLFSNKNKNKGTFILSDYSGSESKKEIEEFYITLIKEL